jgi:hypothetical protein
MYLGKFEVVFLVETTLIARLWYTYDTGTARKIGAASLLSAAVAK